MANKQIMEFTEKLAPQEADMLLLQDGASEVYHRATLANLTRRAETLNFVIGDGSAVPGTGLVGHIYLPLGCVVTVNGWRMSSLDGSSGSAQVDLWHDANRISASNADSICGGNEPALSSQSENSASGLSGWSKTALEGGCLVVNLDSITSITQLTLALDVEIALAAEEV
ncbi:MAG: hypothetical protein ABFS17_09645 [Chloroflexota bacterium]